MKTKNFPFQFLLTISIFLSLRLFPQVGTITLTFLGDNNGEPVTLESVWIKNLTQNCDTTLTSPDFALVIDTLMTGMPDFQYLSNNFKVAQNYPNPFQAQTTLSIYLPEQDNVEIIVSNIVGLEVANYSYQLNAGLNDFNFLAGNDKVYLLTVKYKSEIKTIRMLSSGNSNSNKCSLKYQGNNLNDDYKSVSSKNYFDFNPGDQLLFVGHSASEESGILNSPAENMEYLFQFATNIPCPGLDSLLYGGRYYHTIQIFSQCWMRENLDAGDMILGYQSPSDNGIIEKYCYANNTNNCEAKGGLYIWEEMMQYTTVQATQGICPASWHIPTDEEWKILEGVADSQYGIGHAIWNNSNSFRGTDAGKNLKSTSGWSANGNGNDLFGFNAVSGGYWWQNSFFENTNFGIYWTSTLSNQSLPWYRGLRMDMNNIARFTFEGVNGYSVRCLKDQY
jgi:uncharacterized protein (TIGR02145 family)